MLVFTRRRGESIVIGDNIVIEVVDVDRGKVRIGISAPKDVPVHRAEVAERIKAAGARRPKPASA